MAHDIPFAGCSDGGQFEDDPHLDILVLRYSLISGLTRQKQRNLAARPARKPRGELFVSQQLAIGAIA